MDSLPKNLLKTQTAVASEFNLTDLISDKLQQLVQDALELNSKNLLAEVLPQVERPLLTSLLNQTKWNQQRAARILGINRNTLRKKIDVLGLKKQNSNES